MSRQLLTQFLAKISLVLLFLKPLTARHTKTFFLFKKKREGKREREKKKKKKESQNLFIREAVNAAHFFLKHLRVISLTLQQMYYSFCLSPISRLRILQENDTQFSREVIDQARRNRIWAS